ncbi:MAG: hypothetical protein FWC86_06430, partial [Coriobacteriia bacterium]|nr:hypothetical protein [Coriobacteriia bacterium]
MAEGAQRTWRDSAATHIPNAWHLTRDNRGWNSTFLFPAPELSPPKGIIMELESWDNDTVAVNITNSSGEEWTYGEHFA